MACRRSLIAVLTAILTLALLAAVWYVYTDPNRVDLPDAIINEVSVHARTANPRVLTTDGDSCDWIEFYNPTDRPTQLASWGISDDPADPFKATLSRNAVIPAHGYLVVYLTDKKLVRGSRVSTADLKLSAGERVYLTRVGSWNDCVDAADVPGDLPKDCTWARSVDGTGSFTAASPTCGDSNDGLQHTVYRVDLSLSHASGFYAEPFELTLSAAEDDLIWYTADGSDPRSSATRLLYTGPVSVADRTPQPNVLTAIDPSLYYATDEVLPAEDPVDKATVLRVCAENPEGVCSVPVTATYFVGAGMDKYSGIVVVSLAMDAADLFDGDTGIYMLGNAYFAEKADNPGGSLSPNYSRKGGAWERTGHVTVFDSDRTELLAQYTGVRICGANSRSSLRKSFRLVAYDGDGHSTEDARFSSPLFSDNLDIAGNVIDSYDTLILRNGGNARSGTMFDDALIQTLLRDAAFETARFRPAVLFLNGEFWGCFILQTDMSAEVTADRLQTSPENIALLKVLSRKKSNQLENGTEQDLQDYLDMVACVTQNDMSDPVAYAAACALLDMEAFADYMAAEMYIGNSDWPNHNCAFYRYRSEEAAGDTRWKPVLFDSEMSLWFHDDRESREGWNANRFAILANNKSSPIRMLYSLLRSGDFRRQFQSSADKIAALMDPGRAIPILEETCAVWQPIYALCHAANETLHAQWKIDSRVQRMRDYLTYRPEFQALYVTDLLESNGGV